MYLLCSVFTSVHTHHSVLHGSRIQQLMIIVPFGSVMNNQNVRNNVQRAMENTHGTRQHCSDPVCDRLSASRPMYELLRIAYECTCDTFSSKKSK